MFFLCENNRRGLESDEQPGLAEVGINSGNVVHSNVIHTMGIFKHNHILGQVLPASISSQLM